jgi:hypothetical protein
MGGPPDVGAEGLCIPIDTRGVDVSEDKSRTFCIYDAPTPEAIRKTTARSALPVYRITMGERARSLVLRVVRRSHVQALSDQGLVGERAGGGGGRVPVCSTGDVPHRQRRRAGGADAYARGSASVRGSVFDAPDDACASSVSGELLVGRLSVG